MSFKLPTRQKVKRMAIGQDVMDKLYKRLKELDPKTTMDDKLRTRVPNHIVQQIFMEITGQMPAVQKTKTVVSLSRKGN